MIFAKRSALTLALVALLAKSSLAQFSPRFLQNASYWGDGKSEIDFYALDLGRDAVAYQSEMQMIFTPVFVDPGSFAPVENGKTPGALPAIRLRATLNIPRGLIQEQHAISALWRMDSMSLARLSLAGSDGVGNLFKSIEEKRSGRSAGWKYVCDSYRGQVDSPELASPNGTVVFYEELPLRVRTIDFSKPSGEFEIQLAPALGSAWCGNLAFKSARVSFKTGERAIEVEVQRDNLSDHFVVDRDFPFLLREWKTFDGTSLKLRNSLKAVYANYLKPGDRERALKDPMLRHPD